MLILAIRTDKAESELALFDDQKLIGQIIWEAHRTLADTIHKKIKELLGSYSYEWSDIKGVVCFKGPGSFTGLRIGLSVANAMAYSLNIPITGKTGDDWRSDAINDLLAGKNEKLILPEYGGEVHITKPKK